MARISIIVGHARRDTYCEALGGAYKRGAESGGHVSEMFVLSKMSFDPILHEGFSKPQPLEPDLQAAQDAIGRADHLVLVFPLWMGSLPAILKGFLERILQPGFAVDRESLGDRGGECSHINLYDNTVEGIVLKDRPAFSVQYHPEASPGPHDANYLFRRFIDLMGR